MIHRFEDLKIWQESRIICQEIFLSTTQTPFNRDYSLVDQIRRSSGSVMDNIAEGFGRKSSKEFIVFLHYSKGSLLESKSQIYRAQDRKYIHSNHATELLNKLTTLDNRIGAFIQYLKKSGF